MKNSIIMFLIIGLIAILFLNSFSSTSHFTLFPKSKSKSIIKPKPKKAEKKGIEKLFGIK